MTIILPDYFSQELFDIALEAIHNAVHHSGKWEPRIEVYNHSGPGTIILVECYMDIDDEHPGQSIPCTWYNKSELDKLNISYGKSSK